VTHAGMVSYDMAVPLPNSGMLVLRRGQHWNHDGHSIVVAHASHLTMSFAELPSDLLLQLGKELAPDTLLNLLQVCPAEPFCLQRVDIDFRYAALCANCNQSEAYGSMHWHTYNINRGIHSLSPVRTTSTCCLCKSCRLLSGVSFASCRTGTRRHHSHSLPPSSPLPAAPRFTASLAQAFW
jgi:hypothetical protein